MSEAGWSLKSGEIRKNLDLDIEKVLLNSLNGPSTTCYKYILLKIIIENIERTKGYLEFEKIYIDLLKEFYKIYSIYKNKINLRNKKSLLYIFLKEKNIKSVEQIYDVQVKELNFLSNYVFGALYLETKGIIFGFSKKDRKIYINPNLNLDKEFKENILEEINKKLFKNLGLENLFHLEFDIQKVKVIKEKEMDIFIDEKIEKSNYYQQKFALEINYILKNISDKFEENSSFFQIIDEKSRQEAADILGVGLPKLTTQLQYMSRLNLYNDNKITFLTKKILLMKSNLDYIEPLLYYHLTKNKNAGGHYIYSELINEVIYKLFNNNFEFKISLAKILENMNTLNIDKLNKKDWENMVKQAINCICNPESGFGKMGLLEEVQSDKKDIIYELHSYWVEPLVGAYIIYDLWKEGQTTMSINSIINDKYNMGRIFLMDQDAVMETLEEIKALGLIDINLTAGLNQVTKSSRYTKEDILDMMIKNS